VPKSIRVDERKVNKYQRESSTFDPRSYRRAFYRAGKQIEESKRGHSKAKTDRKVSDGSY
jgi:hypothetical protein